MNCNAIRTWSLSFAAACGLMLAILLLLAFAQSSISPALPPSAGLGIRMETINTPADSDTLATSPSAPRSSVRLPSTPPTAVASLAVQTPAVDVSVDLSQMLKWRYGFDDMGGRSLQEGTFGISGFSEVDQPVESLVIPPKLFPDALIDAGIVEGRVAVKLVIDEKGRAKVKSVLSSTHPSLVPPVVEAIGQALYSIPIRNGRPTKSIVNRTVVFVADPDHVAERRSSINP